MYTRKLIKGQKLFKENDKLEAIYVIKDGEFEVNKNIFIHTGTCFNTTFWYPKILFLTYIPLDKDRFEVKYKLMNIKPNVFMKN